MGCRCGPEKSADDFRRKSLRFRLEIALRGSLVALECGTRLLHVLLRPDARFGQQSSTLLDQQVAAGFLGLEDSGTSFSHALFVFSSFGFSAGNVRARSLNGSFRAFATLAQHPPQRLVDQDPIGNKHQQQKNDRRNGSEQ
jgi:hypothetical protein